jgi:hypothetical protein
MTDPTGTIGSQPKPETDLELLLIGVGQMMDTAKGWLRFRDEYEAAFQKSKRFLSMRRCDPRGRNGDPAFVLGPMRSSLPQSRKVIGPH